jgi:formiminoglutamase
MQDLTDFLWPVKIDVITGDTGFTDGQLAKHILIHEKEIPDISGSDIVIVGIGDSRGGGIFNEAYNAPSIIRKHLYPLNYWHEDISIADLGDIKMGASTSDSYAALRTVLCEIFRMGKTALILGGSHDITLAQYEAYKELKRIVNAVNVDALIDLRGDSSIRSENFLLDMLTIEPNMIKNYSHIGFQSYFVHPRLIETLDKLRFDCFRVGIVKEDIEEMEPVIRNSHFMSFDVSAIKHSDAPSNLASPNGFNGEEACSITRYAGLSKNLDSLGIYGYNPDADHHELTAKQIAQMIWYFIDGKSRAKQESDFSNINEFNQFHTFFAETNTIFLQSRKTNRWWMQMPNMKYVACSYNDYLMAGNNEIPERWLRIMERE